MTIETLITEQTYAGPKTTADTIDIPFHNGAGYATFFEDDDIKVYHIDNAGTETLLVAGVAYHLNKTQNGANGLLLPTGTYVSDQVEVDTALLVAADEFLKIERVTDRTQEQTFTDKTIELALDKLTAICQEVENVLNDSTLAARVTQNETDIATNVADIAANLVKINTNIADIATNTADIATNTADVATNESDITTNANAIASNIVDIASNAADIAAINYDHLQVIQNQTDIATNVLAIASNLVLINANAADIASNDVDIAANLAQINLNVAAIADLDAKYDSTFSVAGSVAIGTNGTDVGIDGLVFSGTSQKSVRIEYEIERRTDDFSEMANGYIYMFYKYDPVGDTYTWVVERDTYVGWEDGVTFSMLNVDVFGKLQYSSENMTGANYYGKMRYIATPFRSSL